jgi:hypothetical protein
MHMTTDSFIYNPCDEEEDDMALACCHGSSTGDLFLLARFPDEDEVDITFRDDTIHVEDNITVTLSATRLLVEIDASDANPLGGDTAYDITHARQRTDRAGRHAAHHPQGRRHLRQPDQLRACQLRAPSDPNVRQFLFLPSPWLKSRKKPPAD